jgi:hypothetical protein
VSLNWAAFAETTAILAGRYLPIAQQAQLPQAGAGTVEVAAGLVVLVQYWTPWPAVRTAAEPVIKRAAARRRVFMVDYVLVEEPSRRSAAAVTSNKPLPWKTLKKSAGFSRGWVIRYKQRPRHDPYSQ